MGVVTYSKRVMFTVGSGIVPMSPVAALGRRHRALRGVVRIRLGGARASACFAWPADHTAGAGLELTGDRGRIGLGLLRGGRDIDWRLVRNIGVGWITTPVIAALVCFTTLFFVQNVFDQPVHREKRFAMSLEVLNRMGDDIIVTEELAGLKDREFVGAAAFLDAFGERAAAISAAVERRALALSEIGDFRIDMKQVYRIEEGRLSPGQIEAIEELAGTRFRYRWALAEALVAHSDEWAYLPESPLNRKHNKQLRGRLEYVFRHFDRRNDRRRTDRRP